MKKLIDLKLKGKVVLLRADVNSDVVRGKVLLGERLKETAKTVKLLKKKGARVVIMGHQGNVGKDDFISLRQHAKLLSQFVKVKFVDDVIGRKAVLSITKLKDGEAILLNNIRFVDDEFFPKKKDNSIVKALLPICDLYVNDAFSVCHRSHTSIVSFPKVLPSACGLLLSKELDSIKKVSMKKCVYILGGAKPETNIKLLKGNKVLACGLFGQTCLVANGKNLGYQNGFLKKATLVKGGYRGFILKLKRRQKNVVTPVDFAVRVENKRKEFSLNEFPLDYQIDDIGSETIKKYVKIIEKAPAIYMKGPAGFSSDKLFSKGTNALLEAVSRCKGFTLVGGGHLSDAIDRSKISKKKFGHISLSGGALLNYVAGEKLAGLKALGWYK
jgi:phosphoglycerate kinase